MSNFLTPDEIKSQFQELKKITDELIIRTSDGSVRPRKGVSNAQLAYAIGEVKKIKETYEQMAADREQHAQEVSEYAKVHGRTRELGRKLLEKYGKDFLPRAQRKYLKL